MTDTAVLEFVDTPDGLFAILAADDGAVLSSGWTDSPERIVERIRPDHRPAQVRPGTTDAAAAVRAYYGGDLAAIDDVRVRQFGTPGQLAGWAALRRITPGAPLSYATFATVLGHPSAVRAAASVCARNAPALFVPCHRVLRTDGSLGGFAWGLEVKRSLLDRENPSLLSADSQA
ncbi:methylated-DNA--[protein]-cysteine S-methyltransferase [Microbacterium schleiferi]|jgi:methylated-DNA-[protein]-cysteine S-methyltransferase|uniref:Methylated-DNA--[protein]-cysteine S-methyltransferase n=1 Tax=Microbacterium schleiferi TaxID=69362 RepID=A0ABU7V2I5_9MICO